MGLAVVTGGAGFIGSHVVRELLMHGQEVRVFDNLSTGFMANLAEVADAVEFQEGDVRDAAAVERAVAGAETVFHLAAFISVPGSVLNPEEADSVNIGGTLCVLRRSQAAGVRRLVFSSSAAVYGEPEVTPTSELARTRPTSPYGLEKLYGEHMCRLASELYGMEAVALRYFNVFGPRQNPNSEYAAVVPKFIDALVAGRTPTVYGDGEQTRDFLYVGDVARANWMASQRDGIQGQVFNVASGAATSVNELLAHVAAATGCSCTPTYAPPRPGDIRSSFADVSRSSDVLGFRPTVSLAEGLRITVEAFRRR